VATRTYGQYCGLARALDVLGERWTLLVLRELFTGPKRFSDLLDALPGLSTGLLTTRLRSLEAEGVVARRRLAPPAASSVYEVTDEGRALEPALGTLARFGVRRLGAPTPSQAFRPQWAMLAVRWAHDAGALDGVEQTSQFEVGDEVFHVRVHGGGLSVADGPAEAADVVVRTDPRTFAHAAHDPEAAAAAVADGRLSVEGDRDAIETCLRVLAPARPR
jgi:DNA-binding HxlR family transcriptional regulator